MKSPHFLLHGIGGVYNYGCEAIVRGTVIILRTIWPECKIRYASRRPIEDRQALADCNIEVVDHLSFRLLKRIMGHSLWRCHLPYKWVYRESLRWVRKSDCIISIGGDIFTLPPQFSSKKNFTQVDFANRVISSKKKFILWGASIGPFDDWPSAVPIFKRILQNTTLITAREQDTIDYLKSLGILKNVVRVADPAFLMLATKGDNGFPFPDSTKPVLGVNLSPLSVKYVFGLNMIDQVRKEQIEILRKIINVLDVNILLVPHVICPQQKNDDDYNYLFNIYESLIKNNNLQDRVALLPPSLGARRTKRLISRCDVLLAARMHCAIAGVSSGVPCLFLSYSAKAKGMAKYVYGNGKWVIPLQDFKREDIIQKIVELIENRKIIREKLSSSFLKFKEDAQRAGKILKDII
ncbi:MAG: polysaccharide pyruvyl transferase family protein [bacterium]